jgi:hypothetical protein
MLILPYGALVELSNVDRVPRLAGKQSLGSKFIDFVFEFFKFVHLALKALDYLPSFFWKSR